MTKVRVAPANTEPLRSWRLAPEDDATVGRQIRLLMSEADHNEDLTISYHASSCTWMATVWRKGYDQAPRAQTFGDVYDIIVALDEARRDLKNEKKERVSHGSR